MLSSGTAPRSLREMVAPLRCCTARPLRLSSHRQPGMQLYASNIRNGGALTRCSAAGGNNADPAPLPSTRPSSSHSPQSRIRSAALQAIIGGVALAGALLRPLSANATAPPAAPPTAEAACGSQDPSSSAPSTSWRDTGIQLADASGKGTFMTPEELDAETRSALSRYASERQQKQLKRSTRKFPAFHAQRLGFRY
jgi:hypothetical protein